MSFAELASTALILERQRDEQVSKVARLQIERDTLRSELERARSVLMEATDKFWVFHCNAPKPDGDELWKQHQRQDKEFMAVKSKEMSDAASRITGILAVITK